MGNGSLIKLLNLSCRIYLKNTNDALICDLYNISISPLCCALHSTQTYTYHDFVGRIVQNPKCSLVIPMTMIICCNCAFSSALFPCSQLIFFLRRFLFVRVWICVIVSDLNESIMIINLFIQVVVAFLYICAEWGFYFAIVWHKLPMNEWVNENFFVSKYKCVRVIMFVLLSLSQ